LMLLLFLLTAERVSHSVVLLENFNKPSSSIPINPTEDTKSKEKRRKSSESDLKKRFRFA